MWELLTLQPSLLNQLSTLLGIGTIFRTCHGVIDNSVRASMSRLDYIESWPDCPSFCITAFLSDVSIVPTKYVSLDPG